MILIERGQSKAWRWPPALALKAAQRCVPISLEVPCLGAQALKALCLLRRCLLMYRQTYANIERGKRRKSEQPLDV